MAHKKAIGSTEITGPPFLNFLKLTVPSIREKIV